MDNVLFFEDQKKINNAVMYYPMGSHQIGEVARLRALIYEKGIDVEKQLTLVCDKYGIEYS